MREYVEELSDRSLNLEEWMDGDKFDQRGKFTDEDFEPFVNNINFGQGLHFWADFKGVVVELITPYFQWLSSKPTLM